MDPSAFDTIARAIAHSGTRRRLVALLVTLPLGGLLTNLAGDERRPSVPIDRIQRRTPQRNRKQRNNNKNNKNNNKNNNNNNKNNNRNNPKDSGGTPRPRGRPAAQQPTARAGRVAVAPVPAAGQPVQPERGSAAPPTAAVGSAVQTAVAARDLWSCPPCQTCNELTAACSRLPMARRAAASRAGTTRCCNGPVPRPPATPPGPITRPRPPAPNVRFAAPPRSARWMTIPGLSPAAASRSVSPPEPRVAVIRTVRREHPLDCQPASAADVTHPVLARSAVGCRVGDPARSGAAPVSIRPDRGRGQNRAPPGRARRRHE